MAAIFSCSRALWAGLMSMATARSMGWGWGGGEVRPVQARGLGLSHLLIFLGSSSSKFRTLSPELQDKIAPNYIFHWNAS